MNEKQLSTPPVAQGGSDDRKQAQMHNQESVQIQQGMTMEQISRQIEQATEAKLNNRGVYRNVDKMNRLVRQTDPSYHQKQLQANVAVSAAEKAYADDKILKNASADNFEQVYSDFHRSNQSLFVTPVDHTKVKFGMEDRNLTPSVPKKTLSMERKETYVTTENLQKITENIFQNKQELQSDDFSKDSYPNIENMVGFSLYSQGEPENLLTFLKQHRNDIVNYVGESMGISDEESKKQNLHFQWTDDTCKLFYEGFLPQETEIVSNLRTIIHAYFEDCKNECRHFGFVVDGIGEPESAKGLDVHTLQKLDTHDSLKLDSIATEEDTTLNPSLSVGLDAQSAYEEETAIYCP